MAVVVAVKVFAVGAVLEEKSEIGETLQMAESEGRGSA